MHGRAGCKLRSLLTQGLPVKLQQGEGVEAAANLWEEGQKEGIEGQEAAFSRGVTALTHSGHSRVQDG